MVEHLSGMHKVPATLLPNTTECHKTPGSQVEVWNVVNTDPRGPQIVQLHSSFLKIWVWRFLDLFAVPGTECAASTTTINTPGL